MTEQPTPRTEAGLREAAQRVVTEAETDDNWDGEYIAFLVPADALEALRNALAIEAQARTEALDALDALPMYTAPAGTHGSPEADAYWSPSVSWRAVRAILAIEGDR